MAFIVTPATEVLLHVQTANPWNNGLPAQFSICVQYKGGVVPNHAAFDKRSRLQGYVLHSASDNSYRQMPDALAKLWLDRRVPSQRLPELLYLIEGRPEKNDITPHLTLNSIQRTTRVVGVIMLGLIIGCLGWLLHQEGLVWGLGLSVCGILFSAGYLIRMQRMAARRKRLTEWILGQLTTTSNPG